MENNGKHCDVINNYIHILFCVFSVFIFYTHYISKFIHPSMLNNTPLKSNFLTGSSFEKF